MKKLKLEFHLKETGSDNFYSMKVKGLPKIDGGVPQTIKLSNGWKVYLSRHAASGVDIDHNEIHLSSGTPQFADSVRKISEQQLKARFQEAKVKVEEAVKMMDKELISYTMP